MDKKEMKKYYAGTFIRLVIAGITINVVEFILGIIWTILVNRFPAFPLGMSFQYYIVLIGDLAGIGVFYLLTKNREKSVPEAKKMNFGLWIALLFSCFGVMLIGNIIGLIISALILFPFGYNLNTINAATNLLTGEVSWTYIITGAIIAGFIVPVLEEMLFRKMFIDHFSKYGKGAAILMSGLAFGLFHGNFSQFFYAFEMGVLLAYIYSYTGKIKYTIFAHMTINFIASGIMMALFKMVDMNLLELIQNLARDYKLGLITMEDYMNQVMDITAGNMSGIYSILMYIFGVMGYYMLMFVGVIVFIVFFIIFLRKYRIKENFDLGEKGSKLAALFNWGAVSFYILAGLLFIYYYVNMILPKIMN